MTTLRQELKTHKRKLIKIGCASGSSFFYCGMNHSMIEQIIAKEWEKQRRKNKDALDKALYRLEHLDKIYEQDIKNGVERMSKTPKGKKLTKKQKDKIAKWVVRMEKHKEFERKTHLPKRIKELTFDTTNPYLDRQVVETYDGISHDEPECKIIIIQGHEKCRYWTVKEYQKAHQPKKSKLQELKEKPRSTLPNATITYSQLTEDEKLEIALKYKTGHYFLYELAGKYHISKYTLLKVIQEYEES